MADGIEVTGDWADEKADDWFCFSKMNRVSLAALLREVERERDAEWIVATGNYVTGPEDIKHLIKDTRSSAKDSLLAEVRRVIAKEGSKFAPDVLQRILSRLEQLK